MDHYPRLTYIRQMLPNIEIQKIDNPEIFFNAPANTFDGYICSIEEGMTLVMLHPKYAVSFDPTRIHRFPIGYAVHKHNLALQAMLNSWLEIQKSTGNKEHLYDYWIQGKGASKQEARWSILQNIINNSEKH